MRIDRDEAGKILSELEYRSWVSGEEHIRSMILGENEDMRSGILTS